MFKKISQIEKIAQSLYTLSTEYKKAEPTHYKNTFLAIVTFLLIPLMFFGWFFGLTTLGITLSQNSFVNNSIKTTGKVLNKDVIKSCTSEKNTNNNSKNYIEKCIDRYGIKYQYTVSSNIPKGISTESTYTGFSPIDEAVYISIAVGDSIIVYFNKDDAGVSRTQFNIDKLGVFSFVPQIALAIAVFSTILFLMLSYIQKLNK